MKRTIWMPILGFIVSIPSFAILIPEIVFKSAGCSSFGLTNLTCTNAAFTPLYNITFSLVALGAFFGIFLIPLALIFSSLGLLRLYKETQRDSIWWTLAVLALVSLCAQLAVIGKFLSQM